MATITSGLGDPNTALQQSMGSAAAIALVKDTYVAVKQTTSGLPRNIVQSRASTAAEQIERGKIPPGHLVRGCGLP